MRSPDRDAAMGDGWKSVVSQFGQVWQALSPANRQTIYGEVPPSSCLQLAIVTTDRAGRFAKNHSEPMRRFARPFRLSVQERGTQPAIQTDWKEKRNVMKNINR